MKSIWKLKISLLMEKQRKIKACGDGSSQLLARVATARNNTAQPNLGDRISRLFVNSIKTFASFM